MEESLFPYVDWLLLVNAAPRHSDRKNSQKWKNKSIIKSIKSVNKNQ